MTNAPNYDTAIALIGMAGRFPGASDVTAFWHNLVAGQKAIRFFTDEELLAAGIEPEELAQPNYVKAGAPLADADMFDAPFFKFSPREAEITDPQHRVFLECVWHALEDAGYNPETYEDLIGIFAGSAFSTYLLHNLYPNTEMMNLIGAVQTSIGNDKDSLASIVSYKLNLRGPAVAVQTFCSTSLVATHLACQSLLNYDCDIALAGGVAISVPQITGYHFEEGDILSPDGECRTFDEKGRGSVMGNGVGVVVLKRLDEALRDGDQIYAVLLGSAINNDGSVRVSYTAPGLGGQTEVIAQALGNAGVDAESIGYIEAHGTATVLGDAVELAAMKKAFARETTRQQFCALGSVKPNVGHLDRASGVTGLMKTALALKHGQIPPSLNFEQAHPDVDLEQSPFYVNTQLRTWQAGETPRRAGVSSFGVGGTNAHVVLEEAPTIEPSTPAENWQLLLLSARTEQALELVTAHLADHLAAHEELNLADAAYTLQVGRCAFNQRRFVVCRDRTEALELLRRRDEAHAFSTNQSQRNRPVTFLLPDARELAAEMVSSLYKELPAWRALVDEVLDLLLEQSGLDLRACFVDAVRPKGEREQRAQAFLVTYALARMLMQWDIQPQALLGTRGSEYVAACLSGVLALEDALRLVAIDGEPGELLSTCVLNEPEIALLSPLTGAGLTSEQARNASTWQAAFAQATRLSAEAVAALRETEGVLLEIGTGLNFCISLQDQFSSTETGHAQLLTLLASTREQSGRAAILTALGQLWLAGVTISWSVLYTEERRLRVSLPTYPFERKRYWLNSPEEQRATTRALAQPHISKNADRANWFYRVRWDAAPLPTLSAQALPARTWLVFLATSGPGEAVAQLLEARGQHVIRVTSGEAFTQLDEQHFQLRPGEQADYEQLCETLLSANQLPQRVLHCWGIHHELAATSAGFRARQEAGFYSLIHLAKALAARVYDEPVTMIALTAQALAVTGQELLQAENSPIAGACKVISQEPLNIICRAIDLEIPSEGTWAQPALSEALAAECLLPSNEPVVAYRSGQRLVQNYEAVSLPEPAQLPFRQNGVYLITGGLGGIGLALAEYLAQTVQARLVLLGRAGLPERSAWADWLATHDEQESTSQKIRALQRIEQAGGQVMIRSVDVANAEELRALIAEVRLTLGALHGVFHAAGITSEHAFKTIPDITRSECEIHFQAKVHGTYALADALEGVELDFCLLFSSLSAVLGGLGFSAYTAANLFLDIFALRQQQTSGQRWLSVNWDTWMVRPDVHGSLGATVLAFAMTPQEGIEALIRVLHSSHTLLVNSTGDLHARIRQWIRLESLQESRSEGARDAASALAWTTDEDYEREIIRIWQQVLGIEQVGLYDNFFDLGGNSLVAIDVIARLKKTFHRQIPAVALFEAPTISALVRYLHPAEENTSDGQQSILQRRRAQARRAEQQDGIAIIGMSGRFPGAATVEQFWENLCAGKETITVFSREELLAAGVDAQTLADPDYVRARPILEQIDQFDANFFGYSPREAELTDPQHRLFLECAWEALEQAGYDTQTYAGSVGVFGGTNLSTYLLSLIASAPEILQSIDGFQIGIGNDKDSLTTTVSYKLNLRGPSFAVQTFCSTSLVATHLASQSLLHGECDIALAGGVSIRVPHRVGYFYQEGGQESSDGHCRAFDAQSQGSVIGDGVGVVVLKRLSDALEDGDTIHAVIKGSAINNDGALKVSYSAPSVAGQAEVVAQALANAGVDASSIGYIEAHGTATELGDPIEVASLTKAFRAHTEQSGYCAIGSVKTNVGHLDRAAGVTGLMKTVMALKSGQIPASLHYTAPNPEIDFEHSPFYVNTRLAPWPLQAVPRRAGVNSLGMGGTNVHVIVEEAPEQAVLAPDRPWQLLLLSARTETALARMADNLRVYLQAHEELTLADVAYTLQVGRSVFEYRHALLCRNRAEALDVLARAANGELTPVYQTRRDLPVPLSLAIEGEVSCAHFLQTAESEEERAARLQTLGQFWLDGGAIDWAGVYTEEKRRRVPLPTYPFERQRYWLEPPRRAQRQADAESATYTRIEREQNIADWFYQASWQAEPLSQVPATTLRYPWLAFIRANAAGEQVAAQLEAAGHPVARVYTGTRFEQKDARTFTIRPGESEDYMQLCASLAASGNLPRRVLHCWNMETTPCSAEFTASQETGFYSLLFLTQALAPHVYAEPVQLLVATTGAQIVHGQETIRPEQATLIGACKVIPQEPLNIACRSIDFELPANDAGEANRIAEQLLAECRSNALDLAVAYRTGTRRVQRYEAVTLPPLAEAQLPFRQNGVYLITGGLGGIGLTLAEHLARTVQARLVLLGRSALPARRDWASWLERHPADDATSQKILKIQEIEALGGQVLIVQADSASESEMRVALQEAQTTFGELHGVFHAAGLIDERFFKSILDMTREDCELHFQAKVHGTLLLARLLQDRQLDFCLLFSSLSAVLGGLGFVAYAAANLFLDACAHQFNLSGKTRWLSVNWDTWMVRANPHGSLGGSIAAFAMQPGEAVEALTRALVSDKTLLVNSTGNLHARLEQWMRSDLLQESNASLLESSSEAVPAPTSGDYEQKITEIWQEVLGLKEVGLYDNFFDLGGNSLIALEVIGKLKKAFRRPIPAVAIFEAPTISLLIQYLQPAAPPVVSSAVDTLAERRKRSQQRTGSGGIALIGMSGRFPGASTIEQFWDNLRAGVESISFFTPEELAAAGVPQELIQAPNYVPARPVLSPDMVEQFDAAFFGYSPREAELTDPQHRLFLECAWEALEQAGYDTQTYKGLVGVFGGTNISTYMLSAEPSSLSGTNNYQLLAGNDKDSLTTSVSYKLNLRGPSLAVQTFCSTSLVAVHLAGQSLLNGECDLALAGGASIRVPSVSGHLYEPGGMDSPDGHCHTFDAEAKGSMFGDGVGVVALKRLEDAIEDGDYIYAVIKGSAINNDGSLKVSYAAPSIAGQAEVVQAALANAGVDASSISYVEAHGTATELGDPIEIASLTKAFRTHTEQSGYCAIGSVKTNVGHLDRAAGVSGLMKTVLALQNEQLPASLHYHSPNPEINFAQSPFYVNTQLRPWPRTDTPRRAGINSLGMGGTNAHVVVEEAPLRQPSGAARPWQLLVFSARTATALEQTRQRLADYLEQHEEANLADVAFTLAAGRRRFEHRSILLCQNRAEALRQLREPVPAQVESRVDRPLAFLFPGVGEQYAGMTHELYQQEPLFKETIDRGCERLKELLDLDMRSILFTTEPVDAPTNNHNHTTNGHSNGHKDAAELDLRALLGRNGKDHANGRHDYQECHAADTATRLRQTAIAQPALFVVEYALARLLMQWGLRPQAMLGYSLGEYVAACLAGVLSLEDALKLVAQRARLISEMPEGAMLAVSLPAEAVLPYLDDEISLAAINSPGTCVLAGEPAAIDGVSIELTRDGVACRRVETTHAFHSTLLEPLRERVIELARTVKLHAPGIPYISNVTGTWITAEQATDPAYWAEHMCQTVQFAEGVGHLLQEAEYALLEVGPGQALTSFVRQHPACGRERMSLALPSLPALHERQSEQRYLLQALGKLWQCGVAPDWPGFYAEERRLRLPLPTYPFERQRYWLEMRAESGGALNFGGASPKETVSNLRKEALADWFYLPTWKQVAPVQPAASTRASGWLLFLDDQGLGKQIAQRLRAAGEEISLVLPGDSFARRADGCYTLRPAQREDYDALCQDLRTRGKGFSHIVHLWSVSDGQAQTEELLQRGFYSLFALAQALGDAGLEACQLTIISNDAQDVTGDERLCPAKATVIGPCRVLPQEFDFLQCRAIDITLPTAGSSLEKQCVEQLLHELRAEVTTSVLALRGKRRWIPAFEPMHLEGEALPGTHLRQRGVYLITGGLGGIGLALAEFLARTVQARLVLVGRNGLPPRAQWPALLENAAENAETARRIRAVLDLEALGSEVLISPADVTDACRMRAVIEQTEASFGALHGILHAAGLPGIGLTQLKTREQAAQVLAPKVQGTLALEEALDGCALDFLVLFSSVTSTTGGGPGQIDYCAANAFLDAYARQRSSEGEPTFAIDWGEWQWNGWEAGLSGYDRDVQSFLREHRQQFGIACEEGAEALCRVLATGQPHMVVSTQDFRVLAEQSKQFTAAFIRQQERQLQQARTAHPRPDLAGSYAPPRNDLERNIAAIWEELLGITPVGIHDNFFELGGNSLSGIDLIARLRKSFKLETLASHVLYEAPSVSAMATYIGKGQKSEVVKERLERGEKRKASLKKREHENRKAR